MHAPVDEEIATDDLQARLREQLAILTQIRREKDDQEDLRELAGLEAKRAEVDPEPGTVDCRPEPGDARQEQEHDRADPEEVLVLLEDAVVTAQAQQRSREERNPDDDPQPLPERVLVVQAVDLVGPMPVKRAPSGRRQSGVRDRTGDGAPRDRARRRRAASEPQLTTAWRAMYTDAK